MLEAFEFGSRECCAYCGAIPNHKDHCIPISFQDVKRRSSFTMRGPWCWACRDCNVHLSNRYFGTFKERCEFANYRLAHRVKPVEWHEYEINELEHGLRSHVKTDVEKRRINAGRADFYQSRDFYLNLESLIWEVNKLSKKSELRPYFRSILFDISYIYHPSHCHSNE